VEVVKWDHKLQRIPRDELLTKYNMSKEDYYEEIDINARMANKIQFEQREATLKVRNQLR